MYSRHPVAERRYLKEEEKEYELTILTPPPFTSGNQYSGRVRDEIKGAKFYLISSRVSENRHSPQT